MASLKWMYISTFSLHTPHLTRIETRFMKQQRLQEIETRLKVLKVCSESIYVRVSMG